MSVTTIGLDLAKNIFQLHGIDAAGNVLFQKKLRRYRVLEFLKRQPPCLIGIEACATSHYWARQISALGHEVKLIPPSYVKPYVRRQKMMPPMLRPFAKRSPGQVCALWRRKVRLGKG